MKDNWTTPKLEELNVKSTEGGGTTGPVENPAYYNTVDADS